MALNSWGACHRSVGEGAYNTTIGQFIRLLRLQAEDAENVSQLRYEHALARPAIGQMVVVEHLSQQADGSQKHPLLFEQYGDRVRIPELYSREAEARAGDRQEAL